MMNKVTDNLLTLPSGLEILSFLAMMAFVVCSGVWAETSIYEGFDYAVSPLANQNGGVGWAGSWYHTASPPSLIGLSDLDLNTSTSLRTSTIPFVPVGGCIEEPTGQGGRGYRTISSTFNFNLNTDSAYYISYLFRRNDTVDGGADEWTVFRLWDMKSTEKIKLITVSTDSDESWNIEDLGTNVKTQADSFLLNTTYFVVIKIVSEQWRDPATYDQVFLKVYDPNEPVDSDDKDIVWTLVSSGDVDKTSSVDFIEISGGTATGFAFDEIRIAKTWEDATGQNIEPPVILKGDINRDYHVNYKDILLLADEWLECTDPNSADCDQY